MHKVNLLGLLSSRPDEAAEGATMSQKNTEVMASSVTEALTLLSVHQRNERLQARVTELEECFQALGLSLPPGRD